MERETGAVLMARSHCLVPRNDGGQLIQTMMATRDTDIPEPGSQSMDEDDDVNDQPGGDSIKKDRLHAQDQVYSRIFP